MVLSKLDAVNAFWFTMFSTYNEFMGPSPHYKWRNSYKAIMKWDTINMDCIQKKHGIEHFLKIVHKQ